VRVQPLEERHAPELFAVVDRERSYLREWLPWVDRTIAVADSLAFIQTTAQQFGTNNGSVAGIWCNREFAGTVGMHNIDWVNQKVELGYWIAARFQGRGIVTGACHGLISHCFEYWKLHRVEIHCATGNLMSRAIPERLGFRREGLLREAHRLNERYHDLEIYGMLASEWKGR
jgi:ribosomal-protein-serine acetyltransferase